MIRSKVNCGAYMLIAGVLFGGMLLGQVRRYFKNASPDIDFELRLIKTPQFQKSTILEPPLKRKQQLSEKEVQWGKRQLLQMLRDRPYMQDFIQEEDAGWIWIVRQFAGEGTGTLIQWNSASPTDPRIDAACTWDTRQRGYIFLRPLSAKDSKSPFRGDALWSRAIYELNNCQNIAEYVKLDRNAASKTISKEEWIQGVAKLEYLALRRTKYVYKNIWEPLMKKKGIFTNAEYHVWGKYLPDTYEKWITSDQYNDGGKVRNTYLEILSTLYEEMMSSGQTTHTHSKKSQ